MLECKTDSTSNQISYTVQPANLWVPMNLAEVWRHRNLLYFLLMRDLRTRYRQSVLGAGWLALQPLMVALIFTLVFSLLARMPTHDIPPVLFHLAGFLSWTLFWSALYGTTNSLCSESELLGKVYFPRLILPLVKVGGSVVDYFFGALVLMLLLFWFSFLPGLAVLALPFYLLLLLGFAAGLGLWLAALHVQYRDVGKTVQSASRLWMYMSPVVYSPSLIPEGWRTLYFMNPVAVALDGIRWSLYQHNYPLMASQAALISAVVVTLLLLVTGGYFFRYREAVFADVA
jgi:lipopolysaccharide transport system permease protein